MTQSSASQPSIFSTRASGILLHPTSLPGRFGIGDLGTEARHFVDFLVETKQQLWQILPLGPTGAGNSPYMCYSAIAGNPLLISLEVLQNEGLLSQDDLNNLPEFSADRVNYQQATDAKMPLLQRANDNFNNSATAEQQEQFQQFCDSKAYWLDDYALFMALKRKRQGSWHTWEPELAKRDAQAIQQCKQQLEAEILFEKFLQFEFFRQWSEIKQYANSQGVQVIGDIPFYVAHDSADVWSNPANFCLDEATNEPKLMAGTPPDAFSETGQLWGNPVYNWNYLQESDFHWWVQRFQAMLDYVDLIRIDHFIGFEAFWAVPQGEGDATQGRWISAPGETFFNVLKQKLGTLPILAEDLGTVTPEAEALRDRFGFPGMKVLQFAFEGDPKNPYLPFNFQQNCLVYTGTHDNDTTIGWYEKLSDEARSQLLDHLGCISSDEIHWDMIRLASSSVANLAILPLQDVLGLGNEARMNFPGKQENNWEWRYHANVLTPDISDRLKRLTQRFGRAPQTTS